MPASISFIPPVILTDELADLLNTRPDVRLLDVRTPAEYENAHIPGAYNVPLNTLGEHGPEIRAAVAVPVVLICQSGQRARQADNVLRAAGMPNLHILDGGVNAWRGAGRELVHGAARLSLERQVRIASGALAAIGALLALTLNPLFALVPAFVGSGLVFAGVTNTCGMAMLLARLPYNRSVSCDAGAMVRALVDGSAPAHSGGAARNSAAAKTCTAG